MMPLLGGAMTACTYHFFYNSPSLDALVALQVLLAFLRCCLSVGWVYHRVRKFISRRHSVQCHTVSSLHLQCCPLILMECDCYIT